MITNRDPETWHDQRPSHPVRPPWLIKAQEGERAAWKAFDEEIDRQIMSGQWDREKQAALCKAWRDASTWSRELYDWYNRGEIPPSVKAAMEAKQDITFDRESDHIPAEQREDARRDNV